MNGRQVFFNFKIALLVPMFFLMVQSSEVLANLKLEPVMAKVKTASSPDNTYDVLSEVFRSAKHTIKISVYQFDSPYLGKVLEDVIRKNRVRVTILFEGYPIPKVSNHELFLASKLVKAGAKVYFYDAPEGRSSRDFKFIHAKYTIVDSKTVVVGSANYGSGGHPLDSSFGNREWETVIENEDFAEMFESAFDHDIALSEEVVPYGASERYTFQSEGYKPNTDVKKGTYSLNISPVEESEVFIHPIFAPDNSLYLPGEKTKAKVGPILEALEEAHSTVDIEQLNFETYWGDKAYNPDEEASPLIDQILRLARKGLRVRILLNDDGIFFDPRMKGLLGFLDLQASTLAEDGFFPESASKERDNKATIRYLNRIAKREGLSLYSKFMDFKSCSTRVLHNKGMIVDNSHVLVGSMNWGESSLKFNREAGVLIKSPRVAQYYSTTFDYDWECSSR